MHLHTVSRSEHLIYDTSGFIMLYRQKWKYEFHNSYEQLIAIVTRCCFLFCISYNTYMRHYALNDVLIRYSVVWSALSSLYGEGQCAVQLFICTKGVCYLHQGVKVRTFYFLFTKKMKEFSFESKRWGRRGHLSLLISASDSLLILKDRQRTEQPQSTVHFNAEDAYGHFKKYKQEKWLYFKAVVSIFSILSKETPCFHYKFLP